MVEFVEQIEKLYGKEMGYFSRRDRRHYQELTKWIETLMEKEQAYIASLPRMREPTR
tara:strand:- start:262 stop:432 length:171 start_codon:yes stop_codon:yes gene_type:complete